MYPWVDDTLIEGNPIKERFVEKIIFAGGLTSTFKIRILQIRYIFSDRFDYTDIKNRFNVSKRTALRWISKMDELGILQPAPPKDGFSKRATYTFNNNWT